MPQPAEVFPPALQPPLDVALAKTVRGIQDTAGLPGQALYEPKFDGYRLVVVCDQDKVRLWSRQGRDLTRYFPDLEQATSSMIPAGCIVDGEAVVWSAGRLNFDALQRRLSVGKKKLAELAAELPASFVGFDVLAVAGQDARALPLSDRRLLLEELAAGWVPPLSLCPQTADRDLAAQWFEGYAGSGMEGLVAKGSTGTYVGGRRIWLKLKRVTEMDIVCGAVVGPIGQPTEIVAGLPIDGQLRIVGRRAPLKPGDSRSLARWLCAPTGPHPWPVTVKGTTLDRFNRDASPVDLTLVDPVVVEVSADSAWSGRSFRHALKYRRVRPELDPTQVPFPFDTA